MFNHFTLLLQAFYFLVVALFATSIPIWFFWVIVGLSFVAFFAWCYFTHYRIHFENWRGWITSRGDEEYGRVDELMCEYFSSRS